MKAFLQWLQQAIEEPSLTQQQIFTTIAVIALLWLIRSVANRTLYRRVEDPRSLYQWRKAITYVTAIFAFLVIGGIWFRGFQSVSTFLGLLSAGLAVALRDPIVNLAGWLFIIWRRPFDVGDRIQIGDHQGDVVDIRIFQFSLMEMGNWVEADQSTGRIIHIPNGKIFREAQANYSKGFHYIWNEIPVLVTFESNWEKAKNILQDIAKRNAGDVSKAAEEKLHRAARKFMIVSTGLAPAVFTSVVDSGVLLTIRYLCEPSRRRWTAQEIWENLLKEFSQCTDIDFAYPTYRYYDNRAEGKPDARAPMPPSTSTEGTQVQD